MKHWLTEYMTYQTNRWAPTTLVSERARLIKLLPQIDGNPDALWVAMASYKPYTRVTTWTRVASYWSFGQRFGFIPPGVNPYDDWREANERRFKNTYTKKLPTITASEALKRLTSLPEANVRAAANFLLVTGTRDCERYTADSGYVVGKGSKTRRVYGSEELNPHPEVSYHQLWRALKSVGLTPHMLRKIHLTELARDGADVFELCETAGWSSPNTAMSYIKGARTEEKVRALQTKLGRFGEGENISARVSKRRG
jgi:hypothetical protein